jgi:flagellar hook-length control protein FliK
MANASLNAMLESTGMAGGMEKSMRKANVASANDSFAQLFDQAKQTVAKPKDNAAPSSADAPVREKDRSPKSEQNLAEKEPAARVDTAAKKDQLANADVDAKQNSADDESSQQATDSQADAQQSDTAEQEAHAQAKPDSESSELTEEQKLALAKQQAMAADEALPLDTADELATALTGTAAAILTEKEKALEEARQALAANWANSSPAVEGKEAAAANPMISAMLKSQMSKVDETESAIKPGVEKLTAVQQTLIADQKAALKEANMNEVVEVESEPELLNALQHISAEKMKTVMNSSMMAQSFIDKKMSADAAIDQLSSSLGGLTATDRPSLLGGLNGSPLLSATQGLRPAGQPGLPGMSMNIDGQLSDKGWGNEFAKRISFMARGQIQNAEIRINPQELGQISVRINLAQDQANISFNAQHANVRDAIENALPRLRELLGESGLQMGNVDVSTQQQNQQQAKNNAQSNGNGDGRLSGAILPGNDDDESMQAREQGVVYNTDRLVDFFA